MVDVVIPLYRPDAGTGILLRRLLKYQADRGETEKAAHV